MTIVASNSLTVSKVDDGVGIKTSVITYAMSTSGTTAPSTGWTSSVPTLVKGQYLWTKTVWTYTDTSSKTGYSVTYISKDGTNGTDGTSGIIVSSVAPDSPQNGQLWQDTSTTPQLVKKWTGTSWVIWELYVENMNVNNLSALSPNLGNITGGSYTSWTVDIDPVGIPILNGIYLYNGHLRSVSIINPMSTDPKAVGGIVNSSISGMEMFGGYTDYYHGDYKPIDGTAEDMIKGLNGMSFWSQLNDTGAYKGSITYENVTLVPWTNLTYRSGYTTAENNPCQYRKIKNLDGSYVVQFRGQVKPVSGKFAINNQYNPIIVPTDAQPATNKFGLGIGDFAGAQSARLVSFINDGANKGTIQVLVTGTASSYVAIDNLTYIL